MKPDAETMDLRRTRKNGKKRTDNMSQKERRRRKEALLRRHGPVCHWCGATFTESLTPTLDHLIPRRHGGSDRLDNLVLACGPCNSRRANPPLGRRRVASDG